MQNYHIFLKPYTLKRKKNVPNDTILRFFTKQGAKSQ
jgi:hypothetical protein